MKKGYILFITICLIMMLFPFIGLIGSRQEQTSENGSENVLPMIKLEDGNLNVNYLSDWGDYFSKNFACRKAFVTINAKIYGNIFHESTTDQVLIGKNDWLYYTNTLNDYSATHLMTERGLNNVTHNIKLMQDFAEQNGSKFIFTIAPNKNSLYDENMPYFYKKGIAKNNRIRLEDKLLNENIHYVNLYTAFENQDNILYFEQDSHWNNEGAALAYSKIMEETDLDYDTYEDYRKMGYTIRADHIGDLAEMLYPLDYELEENIYYNKEWQYEYYGEFEDNMDNFITTTSSKNNQVLLMYRDSFGEAVLPFFADEFGVSYFSRLVPYNMNEIFTYQPNYVIIERVERRISSFAEEAPIMNMPTVELSEDEINGSCVYEAWLDDLASSVCTMKENGDYYQINGIIDSDRLTDTSKIYFCITTADGENVVYDTFWISSQDGEGVNDFGYSLYLLKSDWMDNIDKIKILVIE